jgi:hypothetical protein
MRKLMIGLAPLLALLAFAVVPAMASAQTLEYGICEKGTPETKPPCEKAGEKFVPFAAPTEVTTKGKNFELESAIGTVSCKTLKDEGTLENVGGVGHSKEILEFSKCTAVVEGKTCKVANVAGEVTDQVISETEVRVTVVEPGFPITFTGKPAGCPDGTIGDVTGSTVGKVVGNEVEFVKAGGLKFLGAEAFITGSDEVVTKTGKHPVFIN